MSITFYHILHVISLFVLFGYTFYAFAAPAETRKKVLMITGIASLLVFISGFGLITKLLGVGQGVWPLWAFIKLAAWLGLSALAGFGYRRRGAAGVLAIVAVILAVVAIVTVYVKPTF